MERYTTCGMFTLAEQLSTLKVAELKELAFGLGYTFKAGIRKNVLVRFLSDAILENPQLLIDMSFSYELQAYLDAIEGRLLYEEARDAYLSVELNRFKLLYALVVVDEEPHPVLHFVEDLAERIRPLIAKELKSRESDGRLLFEKLAIGCTNIYGYTDLCYLRSYEPLLEKRFGRKLDNQFIWEAYRPIIAITHDGQKGAKMRPFLSPFAKIADFYPGLDCVDFSVKSKTYDLDTILKYGEMPYPIFDIAERKALEECIDKWHRDNVKTRDVIRLLWLDKQFEGNINMLSAVTDAIEFKDIEQLNECIKASTDFLNNVPFWFLRGNTSAEISAREAKRHRQENSMSHITMGPNLRSMGIETFEQLLDTDELPPFPKPAVKVGRNDLCPCGSGKKFKHCCGK